MASFDDLIDEALAKSFAGWTYFADAGAVAMYLKIITRQMPGFDVAAKRAKLHSN